MPDNMNESVVSSMLAKATTPVESGNFLQEIENTSRDAEKAAMAESASAQLSDISDDLGLITSGEFRVGNGNEPGDGFSGVRIAYPPMTYGGDDWNIVGINNDVMQFGLNSDDGSAYFAGGAGVIGLSGIDLTGLRYGIRQKATDENGLQLRHGRLDMFQTAALRAPAFGMTYLSDPSSGSSLVTNGDFELGDFTAWTKTTEVGGSWSITNVNPYEGTYSLLLTCNADASSILTSDRISVAGGSKYNFSAQTYGGYIKNYWDGFVNHPAYIVPVITVNWYNLLAGGSLLSTYTYTNLSSSDDWSPLIPIILTAPADALSCEIILSESTSYPSIWGYSNLQFDLVSLKLVGDTELIYFDPDPRIYSQGNVWSSIPADHNPISITGAITELPYPQVLPVITLLTTSGNVTAGAHKYKIAYSDAYGVGLAGAETAAVTNDGTHAKNQIRFLGQPYSTREITVYRNSVAVPAVFRKVTAITLNGSFTGTYIDNLSDADISANAVEGKVGITITRQTHPKSAFIPMPLVGCINASGSDLKANIVFTSSTTSPLCGYWGLSAANANVGDIYFFAVDLDWGLYTFYSVGVSASTCAILAWKVDDNFTTLGSEDWYSASTTVNVSKTFDFTIEKAGLHYFTGIVTSKNGTSTDYRNLIHYYQIVPKTGY
jgi:hypothetical protein